MGGAEQSYICVSRPRRFGKSITADMLSAYYCIDCDSKEMFSKYKAAQLENFEKHLNLGITSDHYNVLCKEFLDRVITTFLPHETIEATRFYEFRSNNIFDGVSIVNSIGSEIKVNMYGVDRSISNEYNEKYDEYLNQSMMENSISRKKV